MNIQVLFSLFFLLFSLDLNSQQVADLAYRPLIHSPVYEQGIGPTILIDEGHHNFHTKDGQYKSFSMLLERDGYRVGKYSGPFKKNKLESCKILVISNALNKASIGRWCLPTPSAFTREEISTIEEWVSLGGRLFLIADNMPMGGAAKDLAAAFGFGFTNGFVFDTTRQGAFIFTSYDGTLVDNIVTQGRNEKEHVSRVATFTGQGIKAPDDAFPLLVLGPHHVNFFPDTAWVFSRNTKRVNMDGWCQVAYKKHGKGRVVVSVEAAMFTAQLAGPQKLRIGMNSPEASENFQFLLNLIHWLDGLIPSKKIVEKTKRHQ